MTRMPEPLILPIRGHAPLLHAESWVAPNASVIGQVTLAARASVWYGATLRAEAEIANNRHNAQVYQRLIDLHRDAVG
jgi:carbonic anhydrase/acetyltransferase-like protein (isoleucine patch superfamily)